MSKLPDSAEKSPCHSEHTRPAQGPRAPGPRSPGPGPGLGPGWATPLPGKLQGNAIHVPAEGPPHSPGKAGTSLRIIHWRSRPGL